MKSQFESRLREHWQARDFAAWNQTRQVYRDWLGDHMDPLYYFADLDFKAYAVTIGRNKTPWLWRMSAMVDEWPDGLAGWRSRLNFHPLLGVDPLCFKFTGFSGNGIDNSKDERPYVLRFSVLFVPRVDCKRFELIPERATAAQLRSMGHHFKLDTSKDQRGLPAMMIPRFEEAKLFDEWMFA